MTFEARPVFPDTASANLHGHLVLGGCDVVELAAQWGTPLYVFDEATLRNRCREFREAFVAHFPHSVVAYAAKAFINRPLAQLLLEEGLDLEVVSGGELAVARSVEFPPQRLHFHGNNKTPQELVEALEYGVGRIIVDNFWELELLNRLAVERGMRQEVLLRISPGVDPHTHVYTTTGVLDSKFGFPLETGQADQALDQALKAPGLRLVGLHFHLGSPVFETEPYAQALELVLDLAQRHAAAGFRLEELSPGGGFAIAYTRSDEPPTPLAYAQVMDEAIQRACQRTGLPLPRLSVEPGRAIVGKAGVALYTVGAMKDIPGVRRYVAVDGGMGDNIRPALYDARYEAVVANKLHQDATQQVTIAGKYCESGDILVRDVMLPPVERGDLIAIPAAGAYAPAMASNYNLMLKPPIVMVNEGRARLLRRRESYDDLLRLDPVLEE